MKSNKQSMARISTPSKENDSMQEIYKRFESRSRNIPVEDCVSPREFGKQLASDLIKKIDEKVIVK